jgi:hypothetical protein
MPTAHNETGSSKPGDGEISISGLPAPMAYGGNRVRKILAKLLTQLGFDR